MHPSLARSQLNRPLGELERDRLLRLLAELTRRKCEALTLYQPLPVQAAFHASAAKERLLYGSNRGGKTLPAAAEVARAVLGKDPFNKYPQGDGIFACVGKSLRHVGQIMWPALSRAGAFKMIRDARTLAWRAYRPWDPDDMAREGEAKKAPPLIPPRFIQSVAWEDKKQNVPAVVKLTTGWEIRWFSGAAGKAQGFQADGVWLDEEIAESDWYDELYARTLDRKGRLHWSAAPQDATEQLYNVHERALEELEHPEGQRAVEEFKVLIADNPHIDAAEKVAWAKQLGDKDEQARVRIHGEWAIEGYLVFPTFSRRVHCVRPFAVPNDWTRYVVVDPGNTVCAVLFAAVPNPDGTDDGCGEFVYLYDELYIRGCDSTKFAREVARKATEQRFEAFLIDPRAARTTQIGTGRTIQEHYREALAREGVKSERTGSDFIYGTTDLDGSVEAVRGWLNVRGDGTPKVRVFSSLEKFVYEIEHWHKVRTNGILTDRYAKKHDHLLDCTRYLAAFDPRWVYPRKGKRTAAGALAALARKKQKNRREEGPVVQLGPPLKPR